ncbi:MAG: zinc ribbon domain-containing protein [Clostridiales bacterium]|jgi:hypothetical protein|nr:zinc ribbon domain-containing protein [Clostridiales bacterium]
MPTFCPSCGKSVQGNEKFCIGCGAELPQTQNQPQQTAAYTENYQAAAPAQNFCVNCGNPFDAEWKFCHWCGTAAVKQNINTFSQASAAASLACSYCGSPLGGGGKFCANCGAPASTGGRSGKAAWQHSPTRASDSRAANFQGGYQQPAYQQQAGFKQQPVPPQQTNYAQQPAYQQQGAYQQQPAYQQPAYQQGQYAQGQYAQGQYAQYAQPYYPARAKKKSGFLVPNILLICVCAAMIALLAIYAPKNIDVAKREEQSFETFPITDDLRTAYDRIVMEHMMNPPETVEVDPDTGE